MLNDEVGKIHRALVESVNPLAVFRMSTGLIRMYPANSSSAENLIREQPDAWLGTYCKRSTPDDIRADLEHHCWTAAA